MTGVSVAVSASDLFRRHAKFVAGLLRRLGLPEDDIDDGVQEVFVLAHRYGGYRPGPARPTTWLATIAVNVSRNTKRQGRRRAYPDELKVAEAICDGPTPFDRVSLAESLTRLQAILDRLDEGHRLVFLLHELHGEPGPAIAAALGVPIGTIYSRLHTARERVSAAYRDGKAKK
ncbi:MAG: polymerase sigma factor RpoE [Myxococcaceae bacterium]|nr:polymerase sigma factor RpoE [Myxococcaceae bacterium]